jgi:hypothetical protein
MIATMPSDRIEMINQFSAVAKRLPPVDRKKVDTMAVMRRIVLGTVSDKAKGTHERIPLLGRYEQCEILERFIRAFYDRPAPPFYVADSGHQRRSR